MAFLQKQVDLERQRNAELANNVASRNAPVRKIPPMVASVLDDRFTKPIPFLISRTFDQSPCVGGHQRDVSDRDKQIWLRNRQCPNVSGSRTLQPSCCSELFCFL